VSEIDPERAKRLRRLREQGPRPELPPDPDLDDLPRELAERGGATRSRTSDHNA
jgi:hypothetical protein